MATNLKPLIAKKNVWDEIVHCTVLLTPTYILYVTA